MPYFEKLPEIVQAHKWEKNGDHPYDDCHTDENGRYSEGSVVRYFRTPDPKYAKYAGNKHCPLCEDTYHYHGWLDNGGPESLVCPGDWIIGGRGAKYFACKPDIFARTYSQIPAPENSSDLYQSPSPVAKKVQLEIPLEVPPCPPPHLLT